MELLSGQVIRREDALHTKLRYHLLILVPILTLFRKHFGPANQPQQFKETMDGPKTGRAVRRRTEQSG